jgi:two-component system, OmpR family, osmolarity sensor histidine kinase EnvZ
VNRMQRPWSLSLFGRALITLVFTFGFFALITFYSIVHYALYPIAQRSAADLAAMMVLSSRTLVQLPSAMHNEFKAKLDSEYGLRLLDDDTAPLGLEHYFYPYVERLEQALSERMGESVEVLSNLAGERRWFWVNLDAGVRRVWIGFPRDRIHTRPLEAVLMIVGMAALLVVLTAALLARRVTGPLTRLTLAAEELAKGSYPNPLPEEGPRELASLARQFNAMNRQVRELLANRTLLLAGISHDLRTPLTRLRLGLEMLPAKTDQTLIERMARDIDEMNGLITESVELGRTLGSEERSPVELTALLADLASGQPRVAVDAGMPCIHRVQPLALRRIVGNLIDNALRYSQAAPVILRLDCREQPPVIFVLDRGPGIPEAEREAVFRPFYRMESSRNRRTGGSGLGLAVARQLAVANEMEIQLWERPGGGTIAVVRLPPDDSAE